MKLQNLAPALLLLVLTGCQHSQAAQEPFGRCRAAMPAESRQAVVVTRDGTSSAVTIRLYERGNEVWQPLGGAIAAVTGRNGLAPAGEKREGDGRTPSGIFPLERGFGYGPLATQLPYIVLTPEMIWIDDPRSPLYNRLADKKEGEELSYEIMRRSDDLYKYGIVIEYNTGATVPGAGSAIFFHVWRDPTTPTAGCVAAAEPDIVRILEWLDPAQHPVTVIGDACP